MLRSATLLLFLALAHARAQEIVPAATGTWWEYELIEENTPAGKPKTEGRSPVIVRVAETQKLDGKNLLKFETVRNNVVSKAELLSVEDGGLLRFARISKEGEMTKVDPPQTVVPLPVMTGAIWELDADDADNVRRRWTVAESEKVSVPAGEFRAFHLHSEQTSLTPTTIDRWFVPGIGFIKEQAVTKSPTGQVLQRITLELQKKPVVVKRDEDIASSAVSAVDEQREEPKPEEKPASPKKIEEGKLPAGSKKPISVVVSGRRDGPTQTDISPAVENIYARWQGHGVLKDSEIRAEWIAEDVGDLVPPNFIIDVAKTVATDHDANGIMVLSRPKDGWAEGKYRVDVYLDDNLIDRVRVKIGSLIAAPR